MMTERTKHSGSRSCMVRLLRWPSRVARKRRCCDRRDGPACPPGSTEGSAPTTCNLWDTTPFRLEEHMKLRVNPSLVSLAVAGVLAVSFTWVNAQRSGGASVAIDPDDIGGLVTSSKGPEAGVWVIAETTDLPTKFAKMVVTDDQGRYVLPDLPRASYQVFVRGYGLVDSARVAGRPGQHLDLKAVVAPDGRAAAQVYPANYWLSLMEIPKGEVSDKDVLLETKACYSCHQVGDLVTREVSKNLGSYTSSLDAWD